METLLQKRIYFLGIGGIGMGGLAVALHQLGVKVAGCDRSPVYDPIRSVLERSNISFKDSWDLSHLMQFSPDLIVIGNVCTSDNHLVSWTIQRKVPHEHLAAFVTKLVIKSQAQTPVVIAGTHGKTTTATLLKDICKHAGLNTASFIGGFNGNGEMGVHLVDQPEVFVIEGDEYDCAFFDKQAKLMYYGGKIAVLNACEYDHVDIYPTLKDMVMAYQRWLQLLPPGGDLWVNARLKHRPVWREALSKAVRPDTRIHTYGCHEVSEESLNMSYISKAPGELTVYQNGKAISEHTRLVIPNEGFYESVCLVYGIGAVLGLTSQMVQQGIDDFSGVNRRFRTLRTSGIVVVDDFAHHPSAVKMNLNALRKLYPRRRLCTVFEPRSATSRRNDLYSQWREAFAHADVTVLTPFFTGSSQKDPDRLDISRLLTDIGREGKVCVGTDTWEEVYDQLERHVRSNDIWVLFSNGNLQEVAKWLVDTPIS